MGRSLCRTPALLYLILLMLTLRAKGNQERGAMERRALSGWQLAAILTCLAGRLLAGEAPLILNVQRPTETGAAVEIRCAVSEGAFCRLEESQNLVIWKAKQAAIAWEDGLSFAIAVSEAARSFYRVAVVPIQPLPQMVWIGPGEFMISSPPDEVGRFLDKEDPQTRVKLTHGYWISKYETTQGEFEAVLGFNPSLFAGDDQRPVEDVDWFDAVRYCQQLTERERQDGHLPPDFEYRLPTESEWAYAARAGTTTRYSYGNDPTYEQLRKYAWYVGNSGLRPHPIGQKLPNPWGLYDIYGNVFEWCSDWFGQLPGGFVTDYQGADSGTDRMIRGGYWGSTPDFCRSATRVHFPPATRISYLGFRIVLAETKR
jgi:formylglycine-generating enzyme required for sulfatase activity